MSRERIKVLPLDTWMSERGDPWDKLREECLQSGRYQPMGRIMGRPGIYRASRLFGKNDRAWFELEDGRAFTYPIGDFDYQLASLNALELNDRQVQALQAIADQRLATKSQRRLLYTARAARETRDVGRGARKSFLRFRKDHQ